MNYIQRRLRQNRIAQIKRNLFVALVVAAIFIIIMGVL